MDNANRSLHDVLYQPSSANEMLIDKIKKISPTRSAFFIEDILFDREVEGLEDWLYKEFADDHYFDMLSSDLAFMWLARQNAEWLNQHTRIIEESWNKCRKRKTEEEQTCYNRIKALIEQARAGMSILFLEKCLKDLDEDEYEDEVLETDTYLLIAKLEEAQGKLDPEQKRWSNINIAKKPYLAIVLIYINRKINPSRCLDALWHLNENWPNLTSLHIDQLNALRAYLLTYIRQSLYRYFHPDIEDNYRAYNAFILSMQQEEWIGKLLKEVLDWPGFELVEEKLKKISSHMPSENEHKQRLRDVEKKSLQVGDESEASRSSN